MTFVRTTVAVSVETVSVTDMVCVLVALMGIMGETVKQNASLLLLTAKTALFKTDLRLFAMNALLGNIPVQRDA